MRPLPVSPVRDAPSFVLGLSVVRGVATPVICLETLLAGHRPVAEPRRFVTLSPEAAAPDRRVALALDEVAGVVRLDAAELTALPPLLADATREAVGSLGARDQRLLFVLEAAGLVPSHLLDTWARSARAAEQA